MSKMPVTVIDILLFVYDDRISENLPSSTAVFKRVSSSVWESDDEFTSTV